MVKRKRRLKSIRIDEVSLVGRPANQRPFAFVKALDSEEDIEPAELGAELVQATMQEYENAMNPAEVVDPAALADELMGELLDVVGGE